MLALLEISASLIHAQHLVHAQHGHGSTAPGPISFRCFGEQRPPFDRKERGFSAGN